MDALHFRPEWFDKIPSISLVKSDEKIYLENPAALPPTPVAAKPPLRFQSLPNLQFSHPQLTYTKKQKRQQLHIC